MRYSTQGRTLLELALVRLASLDQLQYVATLIEQLRAGGESLSTAPPPGGTRGLTPPAHAPHPHPLSLSAGAREREQTIDSVPNVPNAQNAQKIPPPLHSGEWSDAVALEVWQAGIQTLPVMTVGNAEQYDTVRATSPNVLTVHMKSTFAKSFCEKEPHFQKIRTALESYLGRPVQLRFELSANAETHIAAPPPVSASPQQNRMKLMSEASQSPFVQKAEEIFKATLTDVKEQ